MHHCTERTENLNFFKLKLLCPWLHNCANIRLVSSGVWICSHRQGHLHRPVANVVPFLLHSQMNGVEGNEGRNCHFLSSHSLAGPLLGCVFTFCLAGHNKGEPTSWPEKCKWKRRWHVIPGVSLYHQRLFPVSGWGREMLFLWYQWESLRDALFPQQFWSSVSIL